MSILGLKFISILRIVMLKVGFDFQIIFVRTVCIFYATNIFHVKIYIRVDLDGLSVKVKVTKKIRLVPRTFLINFIRRRMKCSLVKLSGHVEI